MQPHPDNPAAAGAGDPRLADFERTLSNLEGARPFGKHVHRTRLLGQARRLLETQDGLAALAAAAHRFDSAGLFDGSDWAQPEALQPGMVRHTLFGGGDLAVLECLSELRMLAIATGEVVSERLSAGDARGFLEALLAQNLDLLFPTATEASREQGASFERVRRLLALVYERLGHGGMLAALVVEVERVLLQRPIMVQRVEHLLHAAGRALTEVRADDESAIAARRFIAALQGPTTLADGSTAGDYGEALLGLAPEALAAEAQAFGESMARTGLVAPQHAALLRYLADTAPDLLPDALALDAVGRVSLAEYTGLITDIIRFAIRPETARCIYGLSRMLGRGTLFYPPVPPGLRGLMLLPVAPEVAEDLRSASEWDNPPSANVLLLAGTLSVLGQPRGVDQGHNPTCQAARAISMWAQNDVGYLLELIALAARDDDLVMHFEGEALQSSELRAGLAKELHTELDPVSLLLTPHLDRIYMAMSWRTLGRGGDGHRWVNPEFHGWWVYRGFAELVDTEHKGVPDCDEFVRTFHAAYHPLYNGGRELVYVQPCGVAVTNFNAEFVGWHAISIQRVARGPRGDWRVYFYNPNRDKGQDWGRGVVTSTHDNGELEGESSLPFDQFASRLYVFHYKPQELGDVVNVPAETVAAVREEIAGSWAGHLHWIGEA